MSFQIDLMPQLRTVALKPALKGLVEQSDSVLRWSARLTSQDFRLLRGFAFGDVALDDAWHSQLDAMIAYQWTEDDGRGDSLPPTQWAQLRDIQKRGLSDEAWVEFLHNYRDVIEVTIRRSTRNAQGLNETPSFDGFLGWFCELNRLEKIEMRKPSGDVNAFRSWLRFQVKDYLTWATRRQRRKESTLDDQEFAAAVGASSGLTMMRQLGYDELVRLAQELMRELEQAFPEEFQALCLSLSDHKNVEIAQILGRSNATVGRRIEAALGQLRESILERRSVLFGEDNGDEVDPESLRALASALIREAERGATSA